MKTLVEYFDRLTYDKIDKLREIVGTGELNWKNRFPSVPVEKKLEFARVVFGCDAVKVWVESETDVCTGYPIPVIYATVE